MVTTKESVVAAMDGSDKELFSYLPYMFQDLWELGADPKAMIRLIYKHTNIYRRLRILDLGCGKGAVSVKLAKEFNCACLGIDAVREFIKEAKAKAGEYGVSHLCQFKVADIRREVKKIEKFDIIILGAIGPVLGNYYQTLTALSSCLAEGGKVIIDDGYIEDGSDYTHPLIVEKKIILSQIEAAGMQLADEVVMDKAAIKESEDYIFTYFSKRCQELIEKYPDKEKLFRDYLEKQKKEKELLETKITCAMMVIKRLEG